MAYDGVTWNEALPDNGVLAHLIDDYNRDLRVGIRSRMAREHIWTSSQTATNEGGHHSFISFQQQTSAPTLSATLGQVGCLYISSSSAGYPLVYMNSAGTGATLIGSDNKIPSAIVTQAVLPTALYQCVGTNSVTNVSTAYADLADMSQALTITATGDKVLMMFTAPFNGNNSSGINTIAFDVDGTQYAPTQLAVWSTSRPLSKQYMVTGLSATSHTFKVVWKTNNASYQGEQDGATNGNRVFTLVHFTYV
jgi:hypothetical protein